MASKVPTRVLELRGAYKAHPESRRHHEPPGKGEFDPKPPRYFTAHDRQCWREIVRIMPHGVLTGSDRLQVEIAARVLSRFRQDEDINAAMVNKLQVAINKLGLNPADRAGLVVKTPKANPYED